MRNAFIYLNKCCLVFKIMSHVLLIKLLLNKLKQKKLVFKCKSCIEFSTNCLSESKLK